MAYVVSSECILCGACIAGCESAAITEGETQAIIDPAICIECGTCERNCPSQAIVVGRGACQRLTSGHLSRTDNACGVTSP